MIEYITGLLVEQYGPVGLLAAVIWFRQQALIDAVLTLAEEQPDVNEEKVQDTLNPLSD